MGHKTCPICLGEKSAGDNTCMICYDSLKCINRTLWRIAIHGHDWDKNHARSLEDNGITFNKDNWTEHWDVVRRRLEEGTETRRVLWHTGRIYDIKEIDGVHIKVWVSKEHPTLGAATVSYLDYEMWHFTEPTAKPAQATDDRYPHTCEYCGSPSFNGITIDCTGCNGRGGY